LHVIHVHPYPWVELQHQAAGMSTCFVANETKL
jgi:hypothetical protein